MKNCDMNIKDIHKPFDSTTFVNNVNDNENLCMVFFERIQKRPMNLNPSLTNTNILYNCGISGNTNTHILLLYIIKQFSEK